MTTIRTREDWEKETAAKAADKGMTVDEYHAWSSAEYADKIMANDWRDIPKGFYALTVVDMGEDGDYPLLGYKLFERKVPRTYKTGRTVGRDRWTCTYLLSPGFAWEQFDRHRCDGTEFWRRSDIADILYDPERCRVLFGQVTGRCGCCGRTLTDPNSKMRGIGPECARVCR